MKVRSSLPIAVQQIDSLSAKAGGLALALAAGLVAEVNVVLVAICFSAFVLDFVSGFARVVATEGVHGWDTTTFMRGLAKKLGLVMLWGGAAIADAVLLVAAPGDVGQTVAGLTPTLKFALVATALSEAVSIIQNGMIASGNETIGQALLRLVRARGSVPGDDAGEADP